MNEFDYFFESSFSPTDGLFRSCDIHRPPDTTADGKLYIVNHNLNKKLGHKKLLIPDWHHARRTNSMTGPGSIGGHASRCFKTHGRRPNVILLDYVMQGEVLQSQNLLNGFMTLEKTENVYNDIAFNASSVPPGLLELPEPSATDLDDSDDDMFLIAPALKLRNAISDAASDRLRNPLSKFGESSVILKALLWGLYLLLQVWNCLSSITVYWIGIWTNDVSCILCAVCGDYSVQSACSCKTGSIFYANWSYGKKGDCGIQDTRECHTHRRPSIECGANDANFERPAGRTTSIVDQT